ncbi:NYN domain-containing protein [Shimazuella sp. AN120528]|uniref:NYN domain-containing protein n=1 Tax=Shimazuella soli TaxID=1892854 RepID=UPI001F1149D8|nr:NYN domain-containing protein [Shimazuella soli]MCH5585914.1 NYN domain-containing protein [Shimazuella soli]
MEEWLVVDGYNIIRANPKYSEDIEVAREELIHDLMEYQAVSGMKTFVVFDAYRIKGLRTKDPEKRIKIVFTNKEETADEWIEHFVSKYKDDKRHIYVATSDFLEQRMVLGLGAYRISAREFIEQLAKSKIGIANQLQSKHTPKAAKNPLWESIPEALRYKLEKLRRKK